MTPEVRTVLTTVRDMYVANPASWTQDAFARGTHGIALDWLHPDATCWCLSGAINRSAMSTEDETFGPARKTRDAVRLLLNGGGIIAWNDTPGRTVGDVIALLNKTLEAA